MISDKQAWRMYCKALVRNRRAKRRGLPSAKFFQDLRTYNGKPLEVRWRTLWF